MTKYFAVFLAAFALTACSRTSGKIAAPEANHPPSLWSHHKVLEMPLASCAIKARQALESLGYKQVAEANDSAYVNLGNTRAVVKCAEIADGSFVYMTVGGADGKVVEKQRNAIAAKF